MVSNKDMFVGADPGTLDRGASTDVNAEAAGKNDFFFAPKEKNI